MLQWFIDLVNERGSATVQRDRNTHLSEQLAASLRKVAELQTEAAALKAECLALKGENAESKAKVRALESEIADLKAENARLKNPPYSSSLA